MCTTTAPLAKVMSQLGFEKPVSTSPGTEFPNLHGAHRGRFSASFKQQCAVAPPGERPTKRCYLA